MLRGTLKSKRLDDDDDHDHTHEVTKFENLMTLCGAVLVQPTQTDGIPDSVYALILPLRPAIIALADLPTRRIEDMFAALFPYSVVQTLQSALAS